jgi:hypothetical protein
VKKGGSDSGMTRADLTPISTIANRILRRRRAMRRGARRIWPSGAGRQAHWLDERHQDLIRDPDEQFTGRW